MFVSRTNFRLPSDIHRVVNIKRYSCGAKCVIQFFLRYFFRQSATSLVSSYIIVTTFSCSSYLSSSTKVIPSNLKSANNDKIDMRSLTKAEIFLRRMNVIRTIRYEIINQFFAFVSCRDLLRFSEVAGFFPVFQLFIQGLTKLLRFFRFLSSQNHPML